MGDVERVAGPSGRLVLKNGVVLKGYRVVRFLTAGGMSAIYLVESQGNQYILKEVHGDEPQRVMSLNQEKALLERLDHPGIVGFETMFEHDGYYYLVLEHIRGEPLSDLKYPPGSDCFLRERQVIDWGVQLCDVLEYLHRQVPPVIYRDLKPENIMLEQDGTIRLIDFGIARLHKGDRDSDTELMGSVATASPEHYGGAETDARSDVFTLGATLYDLLVNGRRINQGPFTFAPIRQLNPGVSADLETVLTKATRFEPEQRYQSTDELRRALAACGQPGSRAGTTRTVPSTQAARRLRRPALAAAMAVLAVAVLTGWLLITSSRRAPQPPPSRNLAGDLFGTRQRGSMSLVTLGSDIALFDVGSPHAAKQIASRLNTLYHTTCKICHKSELQPCDIMVGRLQENGRNLVVLFHAHRHPDGFATKPLILATVTPQRAKEAGATPRYLAGWWRDLTRDVVALSRGEAATNSPLGKSLQEELLQARRSLGPGATVGNLAEIFSHLPNEQAQRLRDLFLQVPANYSMAVDQFPTTGHLHPLRL